MGLTVHTDINAIRYNLERIREKIGGAGLTFMVKANAYNHGMKAVACYTEGAVDAFGVANSAEGAFLRQIGIKKPIIVTAYAPTEADIALKHRLIPVVHDAQTLSSAVRLGVPFDLKIDSGMRRLGFSEQSEIAAALELALNNNAKIRAVCTHFYSAESIFAQLDCFTSLLAPIEKEYPKIIKHYSASSAVALSVVSDEVRVGLAAYVGERQAMTVTSRVLALKRLKEGESAGYNGAFTATRDTVLAVVKGGYYDGVLRSYSGAKVIINGNTAPIVGAVSMDTFFVDLGSLRAEIGDTVTLISETTLDGFCKTATAVPYEVLTSFKGRVARRYYL